MSPVVLAAAVGAGLACPAHMWWQQRHGRRAACAPPTHAEAPESLSIDAVRERQGALAAQLRVLDAGRDEGAEVGS